MNGLARLNSSAGTIAAFDLGDTLVAYEGIPLNWESHYAEALGSLANHWGVRPAPAGLDSAVACLRRYNTRLNPREREVPFAVIAGELAACLGADPASAGDPDSARAFFAVFRRRLAAVPGAAHTLAELRSRGCGIAVLTDVPYGMPDDLAREDLAQAGLAPLVDRLLTSGAVGWRKPSPEGLRRVSQDFGSAPVAFYVGNERKDVEAARRAGVRSVLFDRNGAAPAWGQDRTVGCLEAVLEEIG